MSVYFRCPTCGSILADKELLWIEFMEKLNNEIHLTEKEKSKRLEDFLDNLGFNPDSYCCRMRIMKSIDYSKIIK